MTKCELLVRAVSLLSKLSDRELSRGDTAEANFSG